MGRSAMAALPLGFGHFSGHLTAHPPMGHGHYGAQSPYVHMQYQIPNGEVDRILDKDRVAKVGQCQGYHPTVNTNHPWGFRWPTDSVTGGPMHPLPHKPLTPTERRERAELDLNYQRAQRREMELALEARERGMKEYFKNPNQLHYIVDPDTEVRIKSAHVLCEDETHILKERVMRERRPINAFAIESKIAATKGGATHMEARGMHTAFVKPQAQDKSKYENPAPRAVEPAPSQPTWEEICARAEAAAKAVEAKK